MVTSSHEIEGKPRHTSHGDLKECLSVFSQNNIEMLRLAYAPERAKNLSKQHDGYQYQYYHYFLMKINHKKAHMMVTTDKQVMFFVAAHRYNYAIVLDFSL